MLDLTFTAGLLTGLLLALLTVWPLVARYRWHVIRQTLEDIERRVHWYRYAELKRKHAAGDPAVAWLDTLYAAAEEETHPPA